MSETHTEETWQLYRQALKERDSARAELDTLRLLVVDVIRERDEARELARECHELLGRFVRAEGMLHRERWDELNRLREKLRPVDWLLDTPALTGEAVPEAKCPRCGLRLMPGQPCLICSATNGGE